MLAEIHSTTIPISTASTVIPLIAISISMFLLVVEVTPHPTPVVAAAPVPSAAAATPLPPMPVCLLHTVPPDPAEDVVVAAGSVLVAFDEVLDEVPDEPSPFPVPSSRTVTAVTDSADSLSAKLNTVLVATIPELVTVHTAGDNAQL